MKALKQNFEKTVALAISENMKDRQQPLIEQYTRDAGLARITDVARTSSVSVPAATALYSEVIPGHGNAQSYPVGVHEAVGGLSDYPVPGDILSAAIASCLDSTIRIIANRLSIPLKSLSVNVEASVDVRGTLRLDDSVPVGFQDIQIEVDLQTMMQLPEATVLTILRAAERSCVVLQTLRNPPRISVLTTAQTSNNGAA